MSFTGPGAALARLLVLVLIAGFVLIPIVATGLGGLKTLGELRTNTLGLPQEWIWDNYADVITRPEVWRMLGNSLNIAIFTVLLTLAVAAPAAFAFAHLKFFGEQMLFNYLILGLTFPFATAILPLFLKIRDLQLLDTHWGIILPQVAFGLAASVLLMRNAFRHVPTELVEAALIDGASYARIFWSIVLPLSLPIVSTVAIITFVQSWNNYLLPLVVLNSPENYPWPLGLMQFQSLYSTDWPKILTYITITILPAITVFLLAQRYIIAGLTAGAMKA
ncbi:carbohydrate ABC transporter permease [Devosia sp.]|uniref:carbohydrate ABC transporter permease n=1 Tax=Devosia sp. TaxID=1871048 RepID=UPI003A8DDDE3